ncbi:hypothetical protein THRCLA_00593 [Thraustotheca clavata]|uniref:Methyltransferase domain-containing protein n=1 Tax=Thraustotheca clavata TaxID=74557 RepID=A0A1W0ABL8_9STRA|nr:hypothetical protein THRCLA_00593 [Thraustotheca clavata]
MKTAATIALGAIVFFGGIKLVRGKIYDAIIVKLTTEWYRVVLDALPAKTTMLDVGIGTGKALLNNRSLLVSKEISVDGVDYDKDYVVDCKANVVQSKMNEQIQVFHASIYDYDTTTKYDAVYFSASLMIMPDPVQAIKHTLSFLRPNGHVFVTLTVQTKVSWFIKMFKPLLKFFTTIDFGSVTYESDLLLTFQRAGLKILHERCLNGSTRTSTRSYRFYHLTRA